MTISSGLSQDHQVDYRDSEIHCISSDSWQFSKIGKSWFFAKRPVFGEATCIQSRNTVRPQNRRKAGVQVYIYIHIYRELYVRNLGR